MSGPSDKNVLNLIPGMSSFNERVKHEREARLKNAEMKLSFGVSFLDENLGGIYNNDLIVLGAKTGLGKTQLASLIALENVKIGKRIHFIALEADEYEIERRIKYQLVRDKLFSMGIKLHNFNYLDWYYGKYDTETFQYEKEIDSQLDLFSTMDIYYRTREFNITQFERIAFGIKDETDLIVIDHLQYFDTDDENENRAVKQIVKKIRDTALITGKPIILISHIRKGDRRVKQLVPNIEDFHGSSDIGKIATKVLAIAPCYDENLKAIRKTYCSILKCRVDGSRQNMTALLAYNLNMQRYERQYYLGRLSFDETELNLFNFNDMPFWATNAIPGGGKE